MGLVFHGGIATSLGDLWDGVQPSLSTAFDNGGEFAEAFFGGLALALEARENGTFGEDWVSGATILGGELSEWASAGESAAQQFVGGVDMVMASFANGTAWEDWLGGVGIIAGDIAAMTVDGVTSGLDALALWLDSKGFENGRADAINASERDGPWNPEFWTKGNLGPTFPSGMQPIGAFGLPSSAIATAPIVAPPSGSWGAPVVNIGTVNATDTEDIVRKAEKSARTDSWSGGRPINKGMR